jgi:hypothetical protein
MMTAFHGKFADQGLLLVVDELLDYLRTRKDHDLVLDLAILREVGEACKNLKLRFMAGVQEAIFDSDRFRFVAESLGRVKDRFQQIQIATSDVKFVVARRLLAKNQKQKDQIRAYLSPFAKYYPEWPAQLDELVDLFPVHPSYITTFEHLPIVEMRGILQVLTQDFTRLAGKEVPSDYPGLLAADSFYEYLQSQPAYRANPDIKLVMDCSRILEDRVRSALPKKQYRDLAGRIVRAISVHRLTTKSLVAPLGLTPEELRDTLALFHPLVKELSGEPAQDLLGIIEVVLKEIRTTVTGQFLTQNADNRQVFLDLKKTEDFDAIIEKKAETLGEEPLNRAYYSALTELLECRDRPGFAGFKIWERSIEWTGRNTTKLGWLFFGTPGERSTAQPPHDFYLYFIQPYSPPRYEDQRRREEVFFKFDKADDSLRTLLRSYAAAMELEQISSEPSKSAYREKVSAHFAKLVRWLREHFLSSLQVTHEGKSQPLQASLAGFQAANLTPKEQVFRAASRMLSAHFASICGEYPTFSKAITFGESSNARQAVQDALRYLAGSPTQLGAAVLDGLGLLNVDKIDTRTSLYAKTLRDKIEAKGPGQVINRSELLQSIELVEYFSSPKFRLEPEFLIVVIGALIHSGEVILSIPGKDFSASDLKELAATPYADLRDFKHLKKPKDWNPSALRALFELVGLPSGYAVQVTHGETAPVTELGARINQRVENLVLAKQQLGSGLPFWGVRLLNDSEIQSLSGDMEKAKEFLESLQPYNSPAKLKNFRPTAEEVLAHAPLLARVDALEGLKKFADEFAMHTQYLGTAESILPEKHAWRDRCRSIRTDLQQALTRPENRTPAFRQQAQRTLESLRREYIQAYLELYRHTHLSLAQDRQKMSLAKDPRLAQLNQLVSIPIVNRAQLTGFQDELARLRTGEPLTEAELESNPIHGNFYPSMEPADGISAGQRLAQLQTKLEDIHKSWCDALLIGLEDATVQANFGLLKPAEKKALDEFRASREFPDPLPRALLSGLHQAFAGLVAVPLAMSELNEVLFPQGHPATAEEVKDRFSAHLEQLVKGHERGKVRIVGQKADSKPAG